MGHEEHFATACYTEKKKKKDGLPSAQQFEKALKEATTGVGGAAASTSEPAALGITAAQAVLPVTFSLPSAKPITQSVPGATTEKGKTLTTYAGAVEALYKMDPEQVEEAKRQLIDSGYLSESASINSSVDSTTLTAWKRMALDAANSGAPLTTLLAAGGAAPAIVDAMKASNTALQSAQTSYAEAKTGTYTETDPNIIKQSLVSAYAAIGEAAPAPELLDSFVSAYQSAEQGSETAVLRAEKSGEGQAISSLTQQQTDLAKGDTTGAAAVAAQPGPIIAAAKPDMTTSQALDAEAMAQAKASNPAQYYATLYEEGPAVKG